VTTRIITVAAAAAFAVSLAACGSGGSGDDQPATASIAEDPVPAGDAGGEDTLALGGRAVSAFVDYGSEHTDPTKVGVRVVKVRKGRISDFKDFDLDAKQRRSVPYYVDAEFENLGHFALSRNLLQASVEDGDGTEYRPLNLIVLSGTFRPCPEYSSAKLRPGDSFTGCSAILLPKGAQLDRVRFQGDVTEDPVFWAPN